jgi:hypothetical protein
MSYSGHNKKITSIGHFVAHKQEEGFVSEGFDAVSFSSDYIFESGLEFVEIVFF